MVAGPVRGIFPIASIGMGLAVAAAERAGVAEVLRLDDPWSRPRRRKFVRDEYDAHVWDWALHQRRLRAKAEREEAARLKAERDKPILDAAAAKRARKNAKRAARVSDGNPFGAKTEGLRAEGMTARPDAGGGRPNKLQHNAIHIKPGGHT